MKKTRLTALFFFAAVAGFEAHSAELKVIVTGIHSSKGVIRLALFDDAGTYLKEGRGMIIKASDGSAKARFKNLPSGTYALAVHHDENANDKMETNLLGIPIEGGGFSNNASASFGPSSFAEAAFFVDGEQVTINVKLEY